MHLLTTLLTTMIFQVLSHNLIDQVVVALNNHLNESRVVEPVLSALYSLCVYHGLRQVQIIFVELKQGALLRLNYKFEDNFRFAR